MSTHDLIDRMPAAYRSFADLFGEMDAPLLKVIGGVLNALSSQTQTDGSYQNQPDGNFVGYDGLENRGGLAQLLESEWLLRELDADGFVRRIAEGEVLYRKRNFENTGARNTLAVLLDCGPWMLGRNRLIGMAALFYLAIRAERTKATLRWIIPQREQGDWVEGLDRKTIERYLGQIVQGRLPVETVDATLATLDPQGQLECWYVGSGQTAELAAHPDIGSSFLIQNDPNQNTARVNITTHGHRLAQANVPMVDDETCIAALRRPFQPKVTKPSPTYGKPAPKDGLSRLPFHTDWILDRHNLAALFRIEAGLLWQPLLPERRDDGVWLPVRKGDVLLGAQIGRGEVLSAMIATPIGHSAGGPQLCNVTLITIALNATDVVPMPKRQGQVTLDLVQFADTGLGKLHTEPHLSLVQADGRRLGFGAEDSVLHQQRYTNGQVIFQDAMYRVQTTQNALQVINVARSRKMLDIPLSETNDDLCALPRRVLFSPSTMVLAITADNRIFTLYRHGGSVDIEIPAGLSLLHMEHATKGIAWDAEQNRLVELQFLAAGVNRKTIVQYDGAAPELPRYCPLTGTTFAMQMQGAGNIGRFVPIQNKRGWQKVVPVDIADAVARARTLWLES